MATIGTNIRRLRQAAGQSQSALARALGVPPSRMNEWEKGRYEQITFNNMLRIAKALDVTLDELVEGTDDAYDRILSARRDLIRHPGGVQSPTPARSLLPGGSSDAEADKTAPRILSADDYDRFMHTAEALQSLAADVSRGLTAASERLQELCIEYGGGHRPTDSVASDSLPADAEDVRRDDSKDAGTGRSRNSA